MTMNASSATPGRTRTYRPPPTISVLSAFVRDCHQSHVIDKVDVDEEVGFLFGKGASDGKETAIQRLGAGTVHGRQQSRPIGRPERANFHALTVPQRFER